MTLQRAKGTRDFLPGEKILRQQVEDALRDSFERYGFSPTETPVLEQAEVLKAKYAGGAEILKEMFRATDQGKRKLGLRYDLTVPLARVVAMNPTLKLPFKRYQIGKVFRDGPLKPGRYREFMQADIDIIGISSAKAEVEIIKTVQEVTKQLKLPATIKINSRKLLDSLLKAIGIKKNRIETVILALDKLEKIGMPAVKKELRGKKVGKEESEKLLKLLTTKGTNKEKIEKIKKVTGDNEGIKDIEEILSYCQEVTFDSALARGLVYYTGIVIEVYAMNTAIKSSIAGGGRYDKLIGKFTRTKNLPAVGISFGIDVICDILQEAKREAKQSLTQAFIIPIKTFKESLALAQELRSQGINTELDLADKGISKNLDYANKNGIPFVIFFGPEEVKKKRVKLRNMQSGKEELVTVQEIVERMKR